jgi:hypothetical protein
MSAADVCPTCKSHDRARRCKVYPEHLAGHMIAMDVVPGYDPRVTCPDDWHARPAVDTSTPSLFDQAELLPAFATPAPQPGATLDERFAAYHRANPWIARRLEEMTAELVDAGRTRVGIGMLFEVLRWESLRTTTGDPFKLNNSFRSRYARLLIERRPEWADLFELRRLADDKPAAA